MQDADTIQKLAFDGPLSIGQLVALGLVVTLISGYFTWRDCKASASLKLFALLFLTRLIALLVALWMLAGASVVTLLRNAKAKSVVVLVDSSGSMDSVDPVDGSGNSVRWSVTGVPEIGALDRAAGTLRSAQSGVSRLRRSIRTGDAGQQSQAIWEQVIGSVDSVAAELGGLTLNMARTDTEPTAEAKRVSALLKAGLGPLRDQSMAAPDSTSRTTRQALGDRLDEVDAFIATGVRRIENLARRLAAHFEETAGSAEQTRLATESKLARKDKVATWLEAGEKSWLKELEGKERVLRYTFASRVLPVATQDWRQGLRTDSAANTTDLGAALNRATQDAAQQSVDAVILVTDGGHNTSGDPREAAAALRGVPLYIVPIGNSKVPRDVVLHHTHAPRAVFKNDMILVDAMVTAYGCEGETLQIELLSNDVIVEQKTNLVSSAIFDEKITFQQKAADFGRHKLQVRVKPLHDEHSIQNNEAQMEVDVMEDTIRVLVADDRPRWEFRYLVGLFKRDKHVDFEQLLFELNNDAQGSGARPSFPQDLEGWRKYRVIILGDVAPSQLSRPQQELLKKYVTEDGGNLIVIAGETAMPAAFTDEPLGAMIPTIPGGAPSNQGVGLAVTGEGSMSVATQLDDDPLASERVWREMSSKLPIYLPASARPKPTSHVLIAATSPTPGAESEAFLSWQYVGLGRVIYIAAPITYQLRYRNGDAYHHRFWGQLLRWAITREMGSGSKTVRISTDKTSYEEGEQAQVAVRLSQIDGKPVAGAKFNLETKQGGQIIKVVDMREEPASPGTYRGTLENLPLGQLALQAAGATIDSLLRAEGYQGQPEQTLNVDPRRTSESSNPLCNLALLHQLADASGGAVIEPAAVPKAVSQLNTIPDVQQTVVSRQPVWNRWGFLWLFVGCLTFEWLLRRYWRML